MLQGLMGFDKDLKVIPLLVAAKNKNLKGIYPMADASFSVEDAEMMD